MKEWKAIEELYHLAVQKDAEEREALFRDMGQENPEVLEEVRRLLAHREEANRIFETPDIEHLPQIEPATASLKSVPSDDSGPASSLPGSDSPTTGRTMERYQIERKLGEGGMGEVFLAKDTALDRRVALKFLPGYLRLAPAARQRFLSEARMAASLDHPSICVIHEVARTEEGEDFIVMEYVQGETLSEKLRRGPLPLKQTLRIASEVCEALEKAHRSGIVHRDLKTANIMLTPEGHAKVMDFGLAKRVPDYEGSDSQVETLGGPGSSATLGTPAYMSPEQIRRSRTIDTRCDIFSFGIVLYEMLSGLHPFKKGLRMETVNAILNEDPPPLPRSEAHVPDLLEQTVRKMLAKEPGQRYQSIEEVQAELNELSRAAWAHELGSFGDNPAGSKGLDRRFYGLVAAVSIAAAISYFGWRAGQGRPAGPSIEPAVHRQVTFTGKAFLSAMSSDGHLIAYASEGTAGQSLIVQDLSGGDPIELLRIPQEFLDLRWSPDNTELLFTATEEGGTGPGAFIVARAGGTPRRIGEGVHACWSPDGSRVGLAWLSEKGFRVVDRLSGEERSVSLTGFQWVEGLDWAETGLLLIHTRLEGGKHAIWTVGQDGTDPRIVFEDDALTSPRWSSRGDAIYSFRLEGNTAQLLKIPVSPDKNGKNDDVIVLLSGLQASAPLPGDPPPLSLSLSSDGRRMLYTRTLEYSNLRLVEVGGPDGTGSTTRQLTEGTSNSRLPSLSPDGKWVSFARVTGATQSNIYRIAIEGGETEQLTFFDAISTNPAWSSDGSQIAFVSNQGGVFKVWVMGSEGERPRPFAETEPSPDLPLVVWSPGPQILYQRPGNRNYHILDPATEEERPLIRDDSVGWVFSPRYSPDGERVAVSWNRMDGSNQLWAIHLDDQSEEIISNNRDFPIGWSPDGKWIFVAERQGRRLTGQRIVMVSASGEEPRELLNVHFEFAPMPSISLDGRRLVVSVPEAKSDIWMTEDFDPAQHASTAR